MGKRARAKRQDGTSTLDELRQLVDLAEKLEDLRERWPKPRPPRKPKEPKIVRAVRTGDVVAVKRALATGTDPDTIFEDPLTRIASPLLVLAAEAGQARVVKTLLEHGASVDLRERNAFFHSPRETALFSAAGRGHVEVAKLLLEAGADVNADGGAPLFAAARDDHVDLARLLIDAGARLDFVTEDGESVLDVARDCDATRVVRLLKRVGAPRGAETESWKRVRREEAELEKLRRRWRTHKMAPVPRFIAAARKPAFRKLVAWLHEVTDQDPQASEWVPGAVEVRLPKAKADKLALTHQARLRRSGALLVRLNTPSLGEDDAPLRVALVPTADKYRVIAALFPGSGNYGMGSQDAINALRAVEKHTPFDLLMVTHDAIEFRFRGRIKEPERVGRMLFAACPDLVHQGTLTFDRLLKKLRRQNPTVFLWWD